MLTRLLRYTHNQSYVDQVTYYVNSSVIEGCVCFLLPVGPALEALKCLQGLLAAALPTGTRAAISETPAA